MRITGLSLILAAFFAVLGSPVSPQSTEDLSVLMPPLGWRSIGPDRGGRSIAVAGHSGARLNTISGRRAEGCLRRRTVARLVPRN
ncbi:MAG: hypothetical protein Ct9H300mP15_13210 [Gemmatimonadota bacterium]|nr:MAG: hypothetical protein Ct9H300mP15_13210 [Gemmatimonadota bacterium]